MLVPILVPMLCVGTPYGRSSALSSTLSWGGTEDWTLERLGGIPTPERGNEG